MTASITCPDCNKTLEGSNETHAAYLLKRHSETHKDLIEKRQKEENELLTGDLLEQKRAELSAFDQEVAAKKQALTTELDELSEKKKALLAKYETKAKQLEEEYQSVKTLMVGKLEQERSNYLTATEQLANDQREQLQIATAQLATVTEQLRVLQNSIADIEGMRTDYAKALRTIEGLKNALSKAQRDDTDFRNNPWQLEAAFKRAKERMKGRFR